MDIVQEAIDTIKAQFADQVLSVEEHAGQPYICVKRDKIQDILTSLRDNCTFDMMTDLCGMDYLNKETPERFAIVYNVYSFQHNARFRVKAYVPEDDQSIDTASEVWRAAGWPEREAHEMYGFQFNGHSDLKNLLLPTGYEGYPLRKDYPLQGYGERQNFERYVKEDDGPTG